MHVDLEKTEIEKLKRVLECVDLADLPKFAKLLKHAENIDYTMRVVDSLAMVTGISKRVIAWCVVIFGGIAMLTGHLADWLKSLILLK